MMKTIPTTYCSILIAIVFAFAISGCEGLDDWSDLQGLDLFDSDKNSEDAVFKRYTEPGLSTQPLIEYLCDETSKFSKLYDSEIRKVCDYTKLPYHSMSVRKWNTTLKIAPSTRVIVVYDTKKLSDASIPKLVDFVAAGGTLFIPFANEDHRMSYLLGFKPEAEYATDNTAAGWYFDTPMLPNMKGRTYATDVKQFNFAAQNFSSKVKVFATAANKRNCPMVTENAIGKGRVMLLNTSADFSKTDRGFLFAGLLKGLEGIPYPVANTATIFLDDFPSPQYDVYAEPVKSEMNLSMSDFVEKVWWPDMRELGREYKIPYAAMLTFDYRNKIVPPFTLDQWNAKKITNKNKVEPLPDWLVNDVAKNGHELAFHGYNHVSLTKKLWKNPKFIETSMNTVKKKWEISNFGKLPETYVPPSNDIDKMGVTELKRTMPSIKYMCSLYLGYLDEGGDREFDYEPYEKNLFDYPRISSGFYFKENEKYAIQSMYLYTGIWTHFVHPDDIYQIPATADARAGRYSLRNSLNYGWRKSKNSDRAMFPEFKSYVKQFTSAFPQMRFLGADEAGKLVIDWRASRYTHKDENGYHVVTQTNAAETTKQYWFLYASAANADRIEARLKTQVSLYSKTPFMDGYLYSAYTNKPRISLLDMNYKGPKQKAIEAKLRQNAKAEFANYKVAVQKFLKGDSGIDSDLKEKQEMAALKIKLLNTAAIDSVQWNKYAKYMSWQDRGEDVWKMLEEHVTKHPTKNNVMYSKELDRLIGYPNDLVKEKWMSAQMMVTPNDKDLLNSYVANFYTDENQEKIKNALKALLSVDTSASSYLNYIKHLLQYKPDEARMELSDKKPTAELSEVATEIVWLFADNGEYQKAYDWSALSNEIDFMSKMSWLVNLGQKKELERIYNEYIAEHPDDYKAKAFMASVFHEQGRFKDAWVLTNSLPGSDEKEGLRKPLNKDVVYEEAPLQQDLIANHSELFYPDVLKSLVKENRLKRGNFLNLESSLQTNQTENAIQKNELSFNRFDKKNRLHSISATYNKYYEQRLGLRYESNFDNHLMGLQYKVTTAEREGKPNYWARARAEVDQKTKFFYQVGIGFNSAKERNYRSAEVNLFPVETAPGLNQGIYNLRLNLYEDFYLFKYINTSVSVEADYYTNGLISRDTIVNPIIFNPEKPAGPGDPWARKKFTALDAQRYTIEDFDNSYGASITARFMLDSGLERKMKFIPFLEVQYAIGTHDLAVGYPYWMIKSRLYEGGGLGWKLKLTNLEARLEGGYFFDDFSDNFQRYMGFVSYQIFDYTALTAEVELYSQDRYYSNSVQFGIKYNLKKRTKKK